MSSLDLQRSQRMHPNHSDTGGARTAGQHRHSMLKFTKTGNAGIAGESRTRAILLIGDRISNIREVGMAAFTKLSNGSWALKSMTALVKGSIVQVLKADGSTVNLVVGALINTRLKNCFVHEFTRLTPPTTPTAPVVFRSEICVGCGKATTKDNYIYKNNRCRNCHEEASAGRDRFDRQDWRDR